MHASYAPPNGAAGGSGVVIVKEAAGSNVGSGIWDMNSVYDAVKAGTWV
jgi:hypothetical protein